MEAKFLKLSEEVLEDAGVGEGCLGCSESSSALHGLDEVKCRRGIVVVKAIGAMR